jgi:hypothetical protein
MKLTEENFVMFAIKHYDNPGCRGVKDLENDLKRIRYVKRLLRRYAKSKTISDEHLHFMVNHIVILHNLFGFAMMPMLFFKIEQKFWPQLKTFLVFLNLLPENEYTEIPLDPTIIAKLRKV